MKRRFSSSILLLLPLECRSFGFVSDSGFRISDLFLAVALFLVCRPSFAYPEFQVYSQQVSGRGVNCAMCHVHPDGPDGLKPGQIGSLDSDGLNRLNEARRAFEPGRSVDSPVLNAFGNRIVEDLGRTEFIQLRREPAALVERLGDESDLDDDGIPDAREYVQGTDPLNPQHGDPWTLFRINLLRHRFHIFMLLLATVAGLYGLNNLLAWFAGVTEAEPSIDSEDAAEETDLPASPVSEPLRSKR
jgi:hypothetical protein